VTRLGDKIQVVPLEPGRLARIEEQVLAAARDAEARAMPAPRPPGRWRGWRIASGTAAAAVAAAALALFVAGRAWRTDGGARLDLGDASVALGAGSRVAVRTRADGATVVELSSGRVECEVAPRAGRAPFVVQAGDVAVEVVGTAFAVERDDRGEVKVGVTRGVVRVAAAGRAAVSVAAGQKWARSRGGGAAVASARAGGGEGGGVGSAGGKAGPGGAGSAGGAAGSGGSGGGAAGGFGGGKLAGSPSGPSSTTDGRVSAGGGLAASAGSAATGSSAGSAATGSSAGNAATGSSAGNAATSTDSATGAAGAAGAAGTIGAAASGTGTTNGTTTGTTGTTTGTTTPASDPAATGSSHPPATGPRSTRSTHPSASASTSTSADPPPDDLPPLTCDDVDLCRRAALDSVGPRAGEALYSLVYIELFRERDPDQAITLAELYERRFARRRAREAEAVLWLRVIAHGAAGEPARRREAAQRYLERHPRGRFADAAARLLGE